MGGEHESHSHRERRTARGEPMQQESERAEPAGGQLVWTEASTAASRLLALVQYTQESRERGSW